MSEDPKRIVQEGYDRLGSLYRAHYEKTNPERYVHWLRELAELLPPNANLLELGCADGIPTAQFLSQHFRYLGVDISSVQIKQARSNVPTARFEAADMSTLRFYDATFDGIIALYSIIHLPLAEQPALIKAVYQWLKPNGCFLCVVGNDEWTGTESDWIEPGTLMYWSHTDVTSYQAWFIETGFMILESHFVAEGKGGHTLFLLKKPDVLRYSFAR